MARFDPHTYPDRFAFEANARRIREEEIGKVFRAGATRLEAWLREVTRRLGRLAQSAVANPHRHSTR